MAKKTKDIPFSKCLHRGDFKAHPTLTRGFVRGIETWLDDDAFEDKTASIWPKGAWLAMRAHPAALWADLAELDPAGLPSGEGLCLGDAHFDNFGFVQVPGEKTFLFAPNDLDDGGVGPVALDALKYFAVLADHPLLQGYLDILIERYVSALRDPRFEQRVPKHLVPKPATVRKKKLAKYVADGKINVAELPFKTLPLGAAARKHLETALTTAPQLRGSTLLDAVDQVKLAGGSYGGERYWVLIERAAKAGIDLLEFKTMTVPATSFGRHSSSMTQWQRVQFLKKTLWRTTSNEDNFVARLAGHDFLVRSRFAKATLAPLELKDPDDVDDVLEAQVSILAALHRPAMDGIKRARLRYWLRESATLLLDRWHRLMAEPPR